MSGIVLKKNKDLFRYCLKGFLQRKSNYENYCRPFPEGSKKENIQQWWQAWSRPEDRETLNICWEKKHMLGFIADVLFVFSFLGRRRTTDDGRRTTDGERRGRTTDDGRRGLTTDGVRRTTSDDGRRTTEDETTGPNDERRKTEDGGRMTTADGRRSKWRASGRTTTTDDIYIFAFMYWILLYKHLYSYL